MTARSDLNAHFTPLTASRAVSQVQRASPGQPRTSTSGFLTCTHPRAHATAASAQAGSNPCYYVTCTLRPASHWACLGSNVRFDSTFHFLPISRNITCPLISLVKVFLPKLHSTPVACSCSSFQASSQEDTRSVLEVKPLLNRLLSFISNSQMNQTPDLFLWACSCPSVRIHYELLLHPIHSEQIIHSQLVCVFDAQVLISSMNTFRQSKDPSTPTLCTVYGYWLLLIYSTAAPNKQVFLRHACGIQGCIRKLLTLTAAGWLNHRRI